MAAFDLNGIVEQGDLLEVSIRHAIHPEAPPVLVNHI
jgi:hypothetical protein